MSKTPSATLPRQRFVELKSRNTASETLERATSRDEASESVTVRASEGGELFQTGRSNGKGADVRRYLVAERRVNRSGAPSLPSRVPNPGRSEKTPPNVFDTARSMLATLPLEATPSTVKNAMDETVESLVKDGTWPTLLLPPELRDVDTSSSASSFGGIERPPWQVVIRDGQSVISPAPREEIQKWVEAGGLEPFRSSIRDFARAISKRFPPGHPTRAMALAAGYEAFAERFYSHGGKMYYDRMGTDREPQAGLDWADLMTAPTFESADDIRTQVDCLGYTILATEFFQSAGLEVHAFSSAIARNPVAHRQGVAFDSQTQVGFSNGGATALPEPSNGEMGQALLEWERAELRRPDLRFEVQIVDAVVARGQLALRGGRP